MPQLPNDKYNVAWFKLAEFIARGEKERALGLYRLLTHSFDDAAFKYQLEGDILFAFNDKEAGDKYKNAADLYKKHNKLVESAAMYEKLVALYPDIDEYARQLFDVYILLKSSDRLHEIMQHLLKLLVSTRKYEYVASFVNTVDAHPDLFNVYDVYQLIIYNACAVESEPPLVYKQYIQITVTHLMQQIGSGLQVYLEQLKQRNQYFYLYAEDCLRQ